MPKRPSSRGFTNAWRGRIVTPVPIVDDIANPRGPLENRNCVLMRPSPSGNRDFAEDKPIGSNGLGGRGNTVV